MALSRSPETTASVGNYPFSIFSNILNLSTEYL
jgi:hypothetical protein